MSHYENVPKGWCISTIGEVFNLQAGKNISANDIHEYSQNFPYACYGGNGIRGYVSDYNRDGKFPIIGRQGALCGNVNFAKGKFYATEHAVVVTCFAGVNVEWARYVLEAMNLNQYATATAQPGLSVATVNEVEFMLPPLKEQCRIAEFIANSFEAIASLTSQTNDLLLNLDRAKSKILDLAIHGKLVPQDPNDEPASELLKRINPKAHAYSDNPHYADIPESWVECKLGDVCSFESGYAYSSELYKPMGIPLIRISNIVDGYVNIENCVYIKGDELSKNVQVKQGDLLIAMSGATTGKLGIYAYPDDAILNQRVGNIRVKECSVLSTGYRDLFISAIKVEIEKKAYGGAQPNISGKMICDFSFSLPPYNEQLRIVSKVNEFFSQLDMIEKSLQA